MSSLNRYKLLPGDDALPQSTTSTSAGRARLAGRRAGGGGKALAEWSGARERGGGVLAFPARVMIVAAWQGVFGGGWRWRWTPKRHSVITLNLTRHYA